MTLVLTGEKDLESQPVCRQNRDMTFGVLYIRCGLAHLERGNDNAHQST